MKIVEDNIKPKKTKAKYDDSERLTRDMFPPNDPMIDKYFDWYTRNMDEIDRKSNQRLKEFFFVFGLPAIIFIVACIYLLIKDYIESH